MIPNNNYRCVFTPKKPHSYRLNRFFIGIGSLENYIGKNNASRALCKLEYFKLDKLTLKYRKFGRIEFYSK